MASLTQDQIDQLKKKGFDDAKIRSLAAKKGYSMPSTLSNIGNALIKSEKGYGQSMAGAIGGAFPNLAGGKAVEEANQLHEQVKTNLLNTIKAKQANGEDTTRLIDALKTMDKEVNFYDILNTSTGGSLDKSAKQVFGEGFGVATDILGAGALPGGIGSVAKASTFAQGAIQGAKAGAIGGGIFGAAQGATRAAQDDKSAGRIVGAGIGGGLIGGATGGVVGGLLGGVSGAIAGRAQKISDKEKNFALDLVSPKATDKIKQEALRQGRVTEQTLLSGGKILPSKRDLQLEEAVRGVISSKNTPVQNLTALDKTVGEINTGVKAYVAANKVPFNGNQLRSQLNAGKDELRLIFASDATAERTYAAVVDEFMKHVAKKDTAGLLDARQALDSIPSIKKLLDSQGLGENVKKEVVLTVRRQANQYIASLLPKGNKFRATLLRESQMIEAIGNIAEKNTGLIGVNGLQTLAQKYPVLKWLFGWGGTALAGGAGIGVGSAIIGSSN